MAYAANPLLNADGAFPQGLRCFSKTTRPVTFASGSGVLERLTPVAFNTSSTKWVVWTSGGSNETGTIRGFVWESAVALDAAGEVIGNIMTEGQVHYSDIVLPYGETESNLKAAIRVPPSGTSSLRELGIDVKGLTLVR